MNQTELRQTLNTVSRNLESANQAAQENLYSFTQTYIDPCIDGIKSCVYDYTALCFPQRDEALRRKRGRSHAHGEFDFNFYDDWVDDDDAIGERGMQWGTDELDSLLAGRGQPAPQQNMSYGTRQRRSGSVTDPNIIPKSQYLGFLERLPFRIGVRGLKYKPSAAGLQENPGGVRLHDDDNQDEEAAQPLLEDSEYYGQHHGRPKGHIRQRSNTGASSGTTTSHSGRSDIILSDGDEDAVPLDDEFAVLLSRRTTGSDDQSSGKRPRIVRTSTGNRSSQSDSDTKKKRASGEGSPQVTKFVPAALDSALNAPATMIDLKREEEVLEALEEREIKQKRQAAMELAQAKDLSMESKSPESTVVTTDETNPAHTPSHRSIRLSRPLVSTSGLEHGNDTEPFPDMAETTKRAKDDSRPP